MNYDFMLDCKMQFINKLNKQRLVCRYPEHVSVTGCPRKACSLRDKTCSFTCGTNKLRSPSRWWR